MDTTQDLKGKHQDSVLTAEESEVVLSVTDIRNEEQDNASIQCVAQVAIYLREDEPKVYIAPRRIVDITKAFVRSIFHHGRGFHGVELQECPISTGRDQIGRTDGIIIDTCVNHIFAISLS